MGKKRLLQSIWELRLNVMDGVSEILSQKRAVNEREALEIIFKSCGYYVPGFPRKNFKKIYSLYRNFKNQIKNKLKSIEN